MPARPTFFTIPVPRKSVSWGKKFVGRKQDTGRTNIQCYLTADDYETITQAAKICDCTRSEFLRQLGLNAAAVLGVRSDDGS